MNKGDKVTVNEPAPFAGESGEIVKVLVPDEEQYPEDKGRTDPVYAVDLEMHYGGLTYKREWAYGQEDLSPKQ